MAKKDSIKMLEAKIEVLTRARKILKEDTGELYHKGLCFFISRSVSWFYESALDAAAGESALDAAADELLDYIEIMLGDESWLNGWIAKNRPSLNRDFKSMKQYRLQWIDWMLSCLKEDLCAKRAKTRR